MQRAGAPAGARAAVKYVRLPNEAMVSQGRSMSHASKSMSWQLLARIIGEDFASTDQWPRTNEWAWCQGWTPSMKFAETISPMAPDRSKAWTWA